MTPDPHPSNEMYRVHNPPAGPDPSTLTTQQLTVAITNLKELLFARLDAMDKAMELFTDNLTRVPTDVDKAVGNLAKLMQETFRVHDERFNSIGNQFSERDLRFAETQAHNSVSMEGKFGSITLQFTERDVRTEQASRDSKTAVDAALQAQKDGVEAQNRSSALAISKSEAATGKQIDALQVQIGTASTTLDSKINDIKERVTVMEGKNTGSATAIAMVVSLVLGAATLTGLGVTLLKGNGSAPERVYIEREMPRP